MSERPVTWAVDDAVARAERDVELRVPPAEVRYNLLPGWFVKLVFVPASAYRGRAPFIEKLWVRVAKSKRSDAGEVSYVGTLQSRPLAVPDLSVGDVVHFGPQDVADYVDAR